MLKAFSKDLLSYIPSKLLPGIFSLLIIPVITRLFNSTDYGLYALVMSTISIFTILASDWINPSIIRFYHEYEKNKKLKEFKSTVFILLMVSILLIVLISIFLLYLTKGTIEGRLFYYLKLGLLVFALGVAFNVMNTILVAERKVTLYTFYILWRQIVCILFGLGIIWYFNLNVDGLLFGIIIGLGLVLPILFRQTFKSFKFKYLSDLKKSFVAYGFPLIISNIASWILVLSDRYIIEFYRESSEVGLYSVSYDLADKSIQLIVSLIILASGPIVMQVWEQKGENETKLFVSGLTRIYLILLLPAVVGISLISKDLIQILTTSSYYEGYKVMPLVAISIFLFGLQRNFQLAFLFYKKTKYILYIVLVSGVINVLLNFLFIPKYGYLAAGMTTLFSYIIFTLLVVYFSRRFFTWEFPFFTLLRTMTAVIGLSITIWFISEFKYEHSASIIIAKILFGSLVYFMILFITGEIKFIELKNSFNSIFKLNNS